MLVLIRGGGDLASGVVLRLSRAGIQVVVTELEQPLTIRRLVSFGTSIYLGSITIEGITGIRVESPEDIPTIKNVLSSGNIPIVVDPEATLVASLKPDVVVDARMLKQNIPSPSDPYPMIIGLGPGYMAGVNCHAVVETQRGHMLGRVYWSGSGLTDTGIPDAVMGFTEERVLRAPVDGTLVALASIGDRLVEGQAVANISGTILSASIKGVLRGLLYSGLYVSKGMKIGDIDPRNDPLLCTLISDKALAIGGGVLEAVLTKRELREILWR